MIDRTNKNISGMIRMTLKVKDGVVQTVYIPLARIIEIRYPSSHEKTLVAVVNPDNSTEYYLAEETPKELFNSYVYL